MIWARSSSDASLLAAMASCFHRPIRRPGAFFSFAIAQFPRDGDCWGKHRLHPFSAPRNGPANQAGTTGVCEIIELSGEEGAMVEITLAKALKIKNRLTGRLAKAQADILAYNSVPQGQADQVNVPALVTAREELVGALVALKTAINEANREAQRDIYALAEKKGTAQFLASVNTRHGPQPPVYPSTVEVVYVAALKKADVDGLVAGLEGEIDRLQDRLDQFNHDRRVEVDGRTLELAS